MPNDEKYDYIEVITARSVQWASGSAALLCVLTLLLAWLACGPAFGFSIDWQASMAVPAAAITFLLVFLILRAQTKDTRAIQLKLNEIIAALNGANNELIDIENMSEHTLEELHKRYEIAMDRIKSQKADVGITDAIAVHEIVEEAIEEIVEEAESP